MTIGPYRATGGGPAAARLMTMSMVSSVGKGCDISHLVNDERGDPAHLVVEGPGPAVVLLGMP